jgi:hypothetical protein
MFEMRFPDRGFNPAEKLASGEPLERKQQHATFRLGLKTAIFTARAEAKGLKTCQKTNLEFLLKEPFGNSIPESKLRGRS